MTKAIIIALVTFFSSLSGILIFFKKIKQGFSKDVTEKLTTQVKALEEQLRKNEELNKLLDELINAYEHLSNEFVKSRVSDKKIESICEALALIETSTPENVRNGTAEKVCKILGIREINENINKEVESIDTTPIVFEREKATANEENKENS